MVGVGRSEVVAPGEAPDPAPVARFRLYAERQSGATGRKLMDVIRVRAPSTAHAQRLIALLGMRFSTSLDGGDPSNEVELRLDTGTAAKLVELVDALGGWLSDGGLDACQIGFGERSYTLLPAVKGEQNDPTSFLLERTIQLQTALDSRVVIEQAKGILAERESIRPEQAFDEMRREARSKRMKLRDLAIGIVATVSGPTDRVPR
jgi:ANTAR domain-containing protein